MKHTLVVLAAYVLTLSSAPAQPNKRPPLNFVPATSLLPKCKIAVQFNEDERSVKEADYIDGSYCLGLVRGVLGTNEHLSPATPLFCLPPEGMKAWQVAKQVVLFAQSRPELLALSETEFVVRALKLSFPCRLPSPATSG